jgi:hypothetical protein
MTIAYVGFAITRYPILHNYKESLAIWFIAKGIDSDVLNSIAEKERK